MKKLYYLLIALLLLIISSANGQSLKDFYKSDSISVLLYANRIYAESYRLYEDGNYIKLGEQYNVSRKLNRLFTINERKHLIVGDEGLIIDLTIQDSDLTKSKFVITILPFIENDNLVTVHRIGDFLYIGSDNGNIYKSTNNGSTWEKSNLSNESKLNNIFVLDNVVYIVGDNGLIYKSMNFGVSWEKINSIIKEDINDIVILSNGIGFVVCDDGVMYKTPDFGLNWNVYFKTSDFVDLHGIEFFDEQFGIFIGENNIFYRTNNGGKSWIYAAKNNEINDYFNVNFINYNKFNLSTDNNILNYNNDPMLMDLYFKEYIQDTFADYQLALLQTSDWLNYGGTLGYGVNSIAQVPRKEYSNTSRILTSEFSVSEEIWDRLTRIRNAAKTTRDYLLNNKNENIENIFYSELLIGMSESKMALTFDKVLEDKIENNKSSINSKFQLIYKDHIRIKVNKKDLRTEFNVPLLITEVSNSINNEIDSIRVISRYELKESALNILKSALELLNSNIDLFNSNKVFPSYGNSKEELKTLVKYYIIYLEMNFPRNLEEYNSQIDWNNILSLINTEKYNDIYLQFPISYYLKQFNIFRYNNYNYANQLILKKIDQNQPLYYDDINQFVPVSTIDNRFKTLFFESSSFKNPNIGLGLAKYYYGNNEFFYNNLKIISGNLFELYRAEALINLRGDKEEIANIINETRVNKGGLSPLTNTETYEYYFENLKYEYIMEIGPLENGSIHWFNQRRFGDLREGSFEQLPIPGKILDQYKMEYYTFGGISDTSSTNPEVEISSIIHPKNDETSIDLKPTIVWSKINDFEGPYNIQIGGANIDFNLTGIIDTVYVVTFELTNLTNYFVTISNNEGQSFSSNFTTIDYKPESPIFVFPQDDSKNLNTTINLVVELNQGKNQYQNIQNGHVKYQVFKDSALLNLIIDTVLAINANNSKYYYAYENNKYVIKRNYISVLNMENLEYETDYFWRSKVYALHDSSDFSFINSFKTYDKTQNGNELITISPELASIDVLTPIEFSWSNIVNASSYSIELSLESDFKESIVVTNLTDNKYVLNNALGNRMYFWKVIGKNMSGNNIESNVSFFSTKMQIPEAPDWSPSEGELVKGDTIMFTWIPVINAETYNFQLANDSTFIDNILIYRDLKDSFVKLENALNGVAYWRVSASNYLGTSNWSKTRTINNILTAFENEYDAELDFTIKQNFPNPFNPTTKISYTIKEKTNVQLVVYNMLGQRVETLVNMRQSPGKYVAEFDAKGLSSGVYLYKITAGSFQETKKMVLIK